jgi:hypothetical protein
MAAATGGAMSVDVAVIANVRDPISGPSVPGIPYIAFKAGNQAWGEWFLVGGATSWFEVSTIHGLVQSAPWVAGFITWYRQW